MSHPLSQTRQCLNCGYHLIGLSAIGICPECGHGYTKPINLQNALPSVPEVAVMLGLPLAITFSGAALLHLFEVAGLLGAIMLTLGSGATAIITPLALSSISTQWIAAGGKRGWWNALGHIGLWARILAILDLLITASFLIAFFTGIVMFFYFALLR
ncbi:MAG: hypothetical protein KF757_03800 [Phycisphaeraceae bacterium]|nr:hypothetical protein [Phycisphaeraceae bacterium]MCW5763128.1 hypothetical protein [Phycisphaeraceae bacterium]